MDDRRAHFLVMLGNLCSDARTGAFAIAVTMDDGRSFSGVPDPTPAASGDEDEVDDTGWDEDLRLDGVTVRLQDVRAVSVTSP